MCQSHSYSTISPGWPNEHAPPHPLTPDVRTSKLVLSVNWCDCYLCLLFVRCVSRSHDSPTVLLTHPTEIGHGLHDHNLWGQLSPESTKGGVGSCFNVRLIS